MKVLHITTSDYGGAGFCCLRIHQSLLAAGIESKIVVLKNTQHAEGEYQFGFWKDKLHKIPSKLFRMIGVDITVRNKIMALSQKFHTSYTLPVSSIDLTRCEWVKWADVIHLHWVNNYLDYPSFLKQVKKPIVWTLHDESFFYGIAHLHKSLLPGNALEQKYRKVKIDAVRSAENLTIVFLSKMMLKNFGNDTIIEGRKKTVINNSVNTQIFKPQDRVAMRRKYGLDANKTMFVFISIDISDHNKGLRILSDVLSEISPESEILAIGGNPNNVKLKNVRSMGLVKNQQEMAEIISCANYMSMPSYSEAFAQSPLEAMACGLPAVVFPVSGTSELINERNGVICDGFTFEALKKGIQILMSHKYNSEEIRQDMINRFSPESIAQKYIDLYNAILK